MGNSSPQSVATLLERKCHALLARGEEEGVKEAVEAAEEAIKVLQSSGAKLFT